MTATSTLASTKRVGVYARESKDRRGDEHNVADQLVVISAALAARGWAPARTFTDNDLSASNGKPRPAFTAMMRMVDARQLDVIVVRHMDRLVRKVADLESVIIRCERAGVQIVTLAGDLDLATPSGRMVGRMLASVAQHEVELKAERQAMAAKEAAKRGQARKATPRPFGWEDDRVTRRPAEAAAIEWAAGYLIKSGNLSGIAREWAKRELRPAQLPFGPLTKAKAATGGWTRVSIVTILTNPRVAGLAAYLSEADRRALREAGQPRPLHAPVVLDDDGQRVHGKWEPIVDTDTWEAVCRILADPARKPSRKGRSGVRSLLGGLALCACGNVMAANHLDRLGYSQYRCQQSTRDGRPGPHACQKMGPVDDYVTAAVIGRLSRPDAADLITPARPDLRPLRIEQGNKRAALVRLGQDYDDGLITREEWLARRERLNTRLTEIDVALTDAGRDPVLAPFAGGQAAAQVWAGLDRAQRRAVIGTLCEVVISPAGRGARSFDPHTVRVTPRQG
jgi:DNA invertase Pin-like site-specific DNA recombinase